MMYRKILAAVNQHFNSEVAARYALHLARACQAKLYFVFIAQKGLSSSDRETAEGAVERLFAAAEQSEIPVEVLLATGNPVEQMEAIVQRERIHLAFVSTRREDLERRFYARTTARDLSLHLPCTVALVRVVRLGKIHPARIFVPLKGRVDHVPERACFLAKMAEAFHSKVILFHAPRPATGLFRRPIHLTPGEWEAKSPPSLADFRESLHRYGVELERRIVPGGVGRSITVEAAAKRHDLIVMGASQRSLWASFLRGNPVEQVLRETPCDLIILNPKHEDQ